MGTKNLSHHMLDLGTSMRTEGYSTRGSGTTELREKRRWRHMVNAENQRLGGVQALDEPDVADSGCVG